MATWPRRNGFTNSSLLLAIRVNKGGIKGNPKLGDVPLCTMKGNELRTTKNIISWKLPVLPQQLLAIDNEKGRLLSISMYGLSRY